MKRSLLFLVVLLFAPAALAAVSVSIEFKENVVALGQPFYVQVKVEGLSEIAGSFRMSPHRSFSITGSGISQSQSMSFINGKTQHLFSFSKNFRFVAKRIGTFYIGPAYFIYKGKRYQTGRAKIRVARRVTVRRRSQRGGFSFFDNFWGRRREESDQREPVEFFSELYVKRKKVYVNELVPLYIDLYMNQPALRSLRVGHVQTTGFWAEARKARVAAPKIVQKEGKRWYRYRKLLFHLYPVSSGVRRIPAVRARLAYSDYWLRQKIFNAKGTSLTILPVPDKGKPTDFSGNIGQYELRYDLKEGGVQQNVPFEMVVVVTGDGNIKTVSSLSLKYDKKKFRVLAPVVRTVVPFAKIDEPAQKRFVYTVYALQKGNLQLPSVSLSFFDPKQKLFQRAECAPRQIKVLAAPKKEGNVKRNKYSLAKEKIVHLGNGQAGRNGLWPFSYEVVVVLLGVSFVFMLSAFIYRRRIVYLEAHPELSRKLGAYRGAASGLREARKFLQHGESSSALSHLEKYLKKFVLLKMGLAEQSILLSDIAEKMRAEGVEKNLLDKYLDIVRSAETMRYGTSPVAKDIEQLLADSVGVLSELDKMWPDKRG